MNTQLTPPGSGRTGTVPRPPDCRVCMAAMLRSVQPPPSDFHISVRPCSRQGRGLGPTSRETGCPSCVHGAGTTGSLNLGRNPDQAPGCPNQLSTALCLWPSHHLQRFPGGSDSKESACSEGDPGSIPGVGKIRWRREWLPAWRIPRTEKPGGLQSMGSQRVGHD